MGGPFHVRGAHSASAGLFYRRLCLSIGPLLGRIPAGRRLHLTWSMDRKDLVLLPEPDVQTPTTGATGAPLT